MTPDEMIAFYTEAVQTKNEGEIAGMLQMVSAEQIRVVRGQLADPDGQSRLKLASIGVALERNPEKAAAVALVLGNWAAEDSLRRLRML